jgi:uncharacterized iron-regulated protein
VPLVLLMASGCASKSPFDLEDVASPYAYQYIWEQGRIYHNPTGREMTREQLYDYLAGFTVIYVGESHDSVDDHAVQLEILQALHERFPGEVALGLEMLRTDSQAAVDRWVSGAMSDKEMVRLWARDWGAASYPYYKDILAYVREVGMPVVALNRPRYMAPPQQGPGASTEGAVGTSVRPRPDPEIDNDDPYYQAYICAFLAGHDAGPGTLEQFIRAQSLWDETMAESAAAFLSQAGNRSRRLVVFAGRNHVLYGFGIPRRLFRRVPVNYAIVAPKTLHPPDHRSGRSMDVTLPELPLPAADVIWLVGYRDLEDQRVTLGISMAPDDSGGVLLQAVNAGSSAERAGLKEGDIIRAIDGAAVTEPFDLTFELGSKTAGDRGTITIERDGQLMPVIVDFENRAQPHSR